MKALKKTTIKILAEKPEIFGTVSEQQLPVEMLEELRRIPRLAVGVIDLAASRQGLLKVLAAKKPDAFLPTIAYAGIEYGSWESAFAAAHDIKKIAEKELGIYVFPPVLLGAPRLWQAVNGCCSAELKKQFGFLPQCYGCRLYAYALRIPLCKRLQAGMLVAVQTAGFQGCDSLLHERAQDFFRLFLSNFGIKLHTLRQGLLGTGMQPELMGTLECTVRPFNKAVCDEQVGESEIERYFESFAMPALATIISRTLAGAEVDYEGEITGRLQSREEEKKTRKVSNRKRLSR
ncbi:MAG: hypothetical protein GY868_07800 [Deltaproteobacteria bacterium]|nr:hypothetical protein [Deltaproteobacteria bacterium]